MVAALRGAATDEHRARNAKRLPDERVVGVRMGTLFDIAKGHVDMPVDELDALLDEPEFEPRLAAFCIMDFAVRRRGAHERAAAMHALYLDRHDAITSWDMVDRAAPRVIGAWLLGRDKAVLHELAAHDDPLRQRTALTAPLGMLRDGTSAELDECLEVASKRASSRDPVVHKPVGILLRHLSKRDPARVERFLDAHADGMARFAVRQASELLAPEVRGRFVGR